VPSILSSNSELTGATAINRSRLGDLSEQWVYLLAAWKGCEVFPNINSTGKTDIILKHPEYGIIEIDVKTSTWNHQINKWRREGSHVKEEGVWPVEVTPDGDIANWKVSWGFNRTPPGWENFWSTDNRYYTTK
jgi:hypothetical protein